MNGISGRIYINVTAYGSHEGIENKGRWLFNRDMAPGTGAAVMAYVEISLKEDVPFLLVNILKVVRECVDTHGIPEDRTRLQATNGTMEIMRSDRLFSSLELIEQRIAMAWNSLIERKGQ